MKRFVLALLLVLTAGVLVPAAPTAQAAGPPQVLAFSNVIGSMLQRRRVYRNAAEVQNELRAYYDGLIETARSALRDRDLSQLDNQTAAYVRLVESLEYEKQAALQLLEDDKRGARRAFQNQLNRQLPSMLLALPAAREFAQALHADLGELRDVLQSTRAAIASGRPDALLDIARRRAQLDRFAAIVGLVGGRPGRDLADAVGMLGDRLQQVEGAADSVTGEVESGLEEAEREVDRALGQLDQQLATEVRPSSVSLFGGLGRVRVPGRYAFFAAVAQALSGAGGSYGLTRDAMRDRVQQFLVDTRGAGLANLRDCFVASAAQLRAQLAGAEAPAGSTAAVLLETDLSTCDPQAIAAVLAAAAELDPTTTTAPDGTGDASGDGTTTTPAADPSTLSGGGTHRVTEASESLFGQQTFCLHYHEQRGDQIPITLDACTDSPTFDIVYDLGAGTVSGSFSLDLACPGLDQCPVWSTATGHVSGSFGPLVFGQEPTTPPADYPFPEHHWYGDDTDWWTGGPVTLTVSIEGSRTVGDSTVSGSASTTVTGWVEADLWPPRTVPGELPQEWVADFGVRIDYGDSVNPRWDFYAGRSAAIPESNIALPPWH